MAKQAKKVEPIPINTVPVAPADMVFCYGCDHGRGGDLTNGVLCAFWGGRIDASHPFFIQRGRGYTCHQHTQMPREVIQAFEAQGINLRDIQPPAQDTQAEPGVVQAQTDPAKI